MTHKNLKDQRIKEKDSKIRELEHSIKKQRVDQDNMRRSANFNEHENKMLREQLVAFKNKIKAMEENQEKVELQRNDPGVKAELQELRDRIKA